MGRRTVHLALELEIDGESLTGHAVSGTGERRRISGRLGLFGAIERLLADEVEESGSVASGTFGERFHRRSGAGRTFWGPGCRCTFLVTGAESGGSYFVMEVLSPPGGRPLPRIHRHEDQTFHLIEGEGYCRLGDDVTRARVGDFINVPRGTVHCFWNEGTTAARLIVASTPAGVEGLLEESLARAPHPAQGSTDDIKEMIARYAAAAPRYGIEFLTDPRASEPSDPTRRAYER
jgi:quercetin dioxygenase-like cupin family protein